MKLTKNKLFSGILLFGLSTILLVLFNIQFFYLRAIFSFIFLTTIPGLLIMLMLKIRKIEFWEYLVYTIGLSISFLMFAGLAVNWILPWLHITDKPLSLMPLLLSFDIILSIFGFIAYKRNKKISLKINLPKLNRLNKAFFIAPVIFPILSILGATTLNNGGPNYLTMVMLGGISIYVFLISLMHKKINTNIYPWSILTISISLLLMGWLRSWYVSGADINLEYHIFQLIKINQYWSMNIFNDPFNACLSVSILPTIYSIFMHINDQYIIKLIIPLIFSFTPLCVYLFLKKYTQSIYSLIATFVFISQPVFMSWGWLPIRQEIAFLFFGLVLVVLFNKTVSLLQKNLLLLIFLFSMVVSHYSTTYIVLILFIFTYLISIFYRRTTKTKFFFKLYQRLKLKEKEDTTKQKYYLSGPIIFLFIIFTFIWYSQLTKISSNFIDFTYNSIVNIEKIFSEEFTSEQTFPLEQFNIFYVPKDPAVLLKNYSKEITLEYKNISKMNFYPLEKYKDFTPTVMYSKIIPLKFNSSIVSDTYLIGEIIKKLVKLFIIVGVVYLFFIRLKKKEIDMEYLLLIIGSFLVLLAVMILPYASIEYDLMRTYQQVLMILALPATLGGLVIFNILRSERAKISAVLVIFLTYFLFLSGFIPQIIGNTDATIPLNNFGSNYDQLYVHNSEIKASKWLFNNRTGNQLIYADIRGLFKLYFYSNVSIDKIKKDVLPSVIDTNAYVYASYTNIHEKMAIVGIGADLINYNFPTEFLNNNKNLIYNNGESEIFK